MTTEKGVFIMKEKYETPVCEVIEFETEDVITTSGIDPVPEENELPIYK